MALSALRLRQNTICPQQNHCANFTVEAKLSLTVHLEVAKMQLGLASFAKAEIEVFDVPTAYLMLSR